MTTNRLLAAALVAFASIVGCSRATPAPPTTHDAAPPVVGVRPRYGAVMAEVGRRFELAGRAAVAGRFELAEFEVGELGELFDELPSAELPKEGPTAALPALADAFAKTAPADLAKAAKASDARAFADAFARAAAQCNACHKSAEKAFIQVPSVPGKSVPELEAVAIPSAPLAPPSASTAPKGPPRAPSSGPSDPALHF
jgi:cytochrome c553